MYKPQRFMPVFIIGITLLCIGLGGLKLYYEIVEIREGGESYDVVVELTDPDAVSQQQIAHMLLDDLFQHLQTRKVVSRIDAYVIRSIEIVQQQPAYFMFEANFSLRTPDGADSDWARIGQLDGDWIHIKLSYRAYKLPDNKYRLKTMVLEPF